MYEMIYLRNSDQRKPLFDPFPVVPGQKNKGEWKNARRILGGDDDGYMLMVARCEDGIATESAIHRHLKSEDRKINSSGNQWYLTNAHEVNALFREFRDA